MNKILIVFFLLAFFVVSGKPQTYSSEDLQKTNAELNKLYQEKKYADALPLAVKAVEISEQVFGNNHLEIAKALRNLGRIQFFLKAQQSAEIVFEKALSIYKKLENLSQTDGADFAEMVEYLAFIKYQNQKLVDAESLFELALKWFEKTHGANSFKTANSLYVLGNLHYWKEMYKISAQYYKRLFEVVFNNSHNKDISLMMVYYRAKCSYRKAGMEDDFEVIKKQYEGLKEKPSENNAQSEAETKAENLGVINGRALLLQTPSYPSEARQARAGGTVRVEIVIDETGKVVCACAENKAHKALIKSTESAAYRSRFSPTLKDGKPVMVTGTVVYKFVL